MTKQQRRAIEDGIDPGPLATLPADATIRDARAWATEHPDAIGYLGPRGGCGNFYWVEHGTAINSGAYWCKPFEFARQYLSRAEDLSWGRKHACPHCQCPRKRFAPTRTQQQFLATAIRLLKMAQTRRKKVAPAEAPVHNSGNG